MRIKRRLVVVAGILSLWGAGSAYALPLPQPVIFVPKKTTEVIQSKADYQLVAKKKSYTLIKQERYRLVSGEVFQIGSTETKNIDKECLYKYYPSTGKWELITCSLQIK